MNWKSFLLTALLLAAAHCSEECEDIVHNWLVHPDKLPHEVYINSGKFINDLGDYNNCRQHSPAYEYLTFRFVNKLAGMQYIGLCAPQSCEQELKDNLYTPGVEKYLNELYMNKTGAKEGIFKNSMFYNPLTDKPAFDWSNYVTLAFFLVLIALGIAGSFISSCT